VKFGAHMSSTTEHGASWRDEVAQLEAQIGVLRKAVSQEWEDDPFSERGSTLGSPRLARQPSLSTSAHLAEVPPSTSSGSDNTNQGDALSTSCPASASMQVPASQPSEGDQVKEMLHELEKLELALVHERQQNNRLLAEKLAIEKAHARDMAELEGMLKQSMEEVESLRAENRRLLGENAKLLVVGEVDATTTTLCTASEAEIDSSVGVLGRMASMGHIGAGSPCSR